MPYCQLSNTINIQITVAKSWSFFLVDRVYSLWCDCMLVVFFYYYFILSSYVPFVLFLQYMHHVLLWQCYRSSWSFCFNKLDFIWFDIGSKNLERNNSVLTKGIFSNERGGLRRSKLATQKEINETRTTKRVVCDSRMRECCQLIRRPGR